MENTAIQTARNLTEKSTTNGEISSLTLSDKRKFIAIGSVINKIRVIQGWNMVSPKDAEPVAKVWLEQLDRYKISPELYNLLLDKAIDRRLNFLNNGQNPPALTVELLLAEFKQYRAAMIEEYSRKERDIGRWRFQINEIENALEPFQPETPGEHPVVRGSVMKGLIVPSVEKQQELYNGKRESVLSSLRHHHKNLVENCSDLSECLDVVMQKLSQEIKGLKEFWKNTFLNEEPPRR